MFQSATLKVDIRNVNMAYAWMELDCSRANVMSAGRAHIVTLISTSVSLNTVKIMPRATTRLEITLAPVSLDTLVGTVRRISTSALHGLVFIMRRVRIR